MLSQKYGVKSKTYESHGNSLMAELLSQESSVKAVLPPMQTSSSVLHYQWLCWITLLQWHWRGHKPELSPYPLTWGHATVLQKRCTKPGLLAEIKPCIFVFLLLTKVLRLWVLLPNWTMVTFVSKPCWSCYCKLILWQPGFLLPCWSRQI